MGTKNNPGKFDCYHNAEPDEPIFILLGRDPQGPALVEAWANERALMIERGEKPDSHWAKVNEARQCAQAMRDWHEDNRPTTPSDKENAG